MIYREAIIIAIFYILNIVVLTIEIVSTIDIVLIIEIISIEDIFITFEGVIVVLTVEFVPARVLFVSVLFVVFMSAIERS